MPNPKLRLYFREPTLSYIYVNSKAGIESPRDLEGKRVGIPQWDNTAGVWARGALQNYYKIDLTRINWLSARSKMMSPAPGIQIEPLEQPGDLDSLLLEGALDAVIEPDVLPSITRRDPRVRHLFRDYKTEEQIYFKRTGIFPISHVVTLKQEFVDRYPDAPVALLKAFRHARDVAFSRLEGDNPQILVISWVAAAVDEQRALMGENYWAYNIENNRRALEALTQFAHEQGLSPQRIDYETFFHPKAAALPGS
jgi:4,5-dihydroxyphthalate decarboxylase